MEYDCMICGTVIPDYDPKMCCSGRDCGCMGQPTEPPICSTVCYDKMKENVEMYNIINNYGWIKVKRFKEDTPLNVLRKDWQGEYEKLEEHHKNETGFLIAKCRELAKRIIDGN